MVARAEFARISGVQEIRATVEWKKNRTKIKKEAVTNIMGILVSVQCMR